MAGGNSYDSWPTPQDRQITNTLEDMLRDDASRLSPDDFQPVQPRSSTGWAIGLTVTVILAIVSVLVFYSSPGVLILILTIGGAVGTLCYTRIDHVSDHNQRLRQYDEKKLQRLQNLEHTRLTQRTEAMGALKDLEIALQGHRSNVDVARIQAQAQIESARYQALGVERDYEFQGKLFELQHRLAADESKNERDWKSQEANLDRQARIDNVQAKVEAEINLLTAQHKLENPSTEEERKRKEFQFQMTMETLSKIAELAKTDPTTAQNLYEMHLRGDL